MAGIYHAKSKEVSMHTPSKMVAVSAIALLLTACGTQEDTTPGEAAAPPTEPSGPGTGIAELPASPPSAPDSPAGSGPSPEYGGGALSSGGTASPSGGAAAPEQEKEKSDSK